MLVERGKPYSIFKAVSNTFLICTGWTRRERQSGRKLGPRRGGAGGEPENPALTILTGEVLTGEVFYLK